MGRPPQGIRVAIRRLDADESGSDCSAPTEPHNSHDCNGETSAASAGMVPSHMYASKGGWQRAAEGEEGEVVTCGQHVMTGYWGDPKATAAAFLPGTQPHGQHLSLTACNTLGSQSNFAIQD